MSPPIEVERNLIRLAVLVLDPIRDRAAVPIVVTSGYRPRALNERIGGALNSDHMYGLAADVYALGLSLDQLGKVIYDLRNTLPLRKVIYEFSEWIHVAVAPEGEAPRRQFLTARLERGRTVYEERHV